MAEAQTKIATEQSTTETEELQTGFGSMKGASVDNKSANFLDASQTTKKNVLNNNSNYKTKLIHDEGDTPGSLKSGYLKDVEFEGIAYPTVHQKNLPGFEFFIDNRSKQSKSKDIVKLQMGLNYLYDDFESEKGIKKLKLKENYNKNTKEGIAFFQENYIRPKDTSTRVDGVLDGKTLIWLDKAILEKQGQTLGKLAYEASKKLEERREAGEIKFGVCELNTEFWKPLPGQFSTLAMKENAIPSEAIMSAYIDYAITECHTSIYIIWYKTLLDYWGKDIFNEVFKWRSEEKPGMAITISAAKVDVGLLHFRYEIVEDLNIPDDLIPGDWLSYKNDERYELRHPDGPYSYENVIYIGDGKYNGFAMGYDISEEEIKESMSSAYSDEPTEDEKKNERYDPNITGENPEPFGFLPIVRRLDVMKIEEIKRNIKG